MNLLEVRDLEVDHAGAPVLRGVSLHVAAREIVAVVGANGSGKSTLLRSIVGLSPARTGQVAFKGQSLRGIAPQRVVQRGIGLVPQERALFPHSSVLDNLKVGGFLLKDRRELATRLERVLEQFPILKQRSRQIARTLSGGEQQMLAIGRALMSRPELLMLDEPSLALAPSVVQSIERVIAELCEQGTSVLLVEQNVKLALGVAHRAYALATGRVVLEGAARTLMQDPALMSVYFGGSVGRHSSAAPALSAALASRGGSLPPA
jgi:branched-chain amino acid transport system ATP-binding protein